MKKLNLIAVSLLALAFGRPAGLCTANTLTEDVGEINDRLAKLEAENLELKRQLALPTVLDPAPPDGLLDLLCKGADVDIDDVRWRMRAGLDAEQAVEAAMAQKRHDDGTEAKAIAAAAKAKK